MTHQDVRTRVRSLVVEVAPIAVDRVHPATTLGGDLGYDSLTVLELATLIEAEFRLSRIPDEELRSVTTLGQAEDLVVRALHGQPGERGRETA